MDLVGLKIETALVVEQCLHHFTLFEMNWHGHKFLWSCMIWGSHSSAAEDSFLLECDIVSLGEWFPVFRRYYNALKHQELLIQPCNVMSQTTLIFFGVAMANYNEKFVTFLQERKGVYNTNNEYHNRNMMHNFQREVQPLYKKNQTREPHTILFRDRE